GLRAQRSRRRAVFDWAGDGLLSRGPRNRHERSEVVMAGAVKDSFYDAGALRQIATNLFYGWGYNFYRVENQLRADDQLIRSKAASLLGIAMAGVETVEGASRREFLPPPSRGKPFPDPAAVAIAQRLERLARG